jgi:hypothetical protein
MIDFQSPTTVESRNHRPCHSPSPWGEGRGEGELNLRERSERHFLCCSLVGELCSRGRQSALMPCPSGTSENSQLHARVIYGWVHGPRPTQLVVRFGLLTPTYAYLRRLPPGQYVSPPSGDGEFTLAAKLTPMQTKSRPMQTKKRSLTSARPSIRPATDTRFPK